MFPVATVGSTGNGICVAHEDPIPITFMVITGNPAFIIGGMPVACVGTSMVQASCGHSGIVVTGSATYTTNMGQVARVGSQVVGSGLTGIIVAGNSNFMVGD